MQLLENRHERMQQPGQSVDVCIDRRPAKLLLDFTHDLKGDE